MIEKKINNITEQHFNDARDHVRKILNTLNQNLFYHDKNHTEQVVLAALKIAKKQDISTSDNWLVGVAAYFHDTGFTKMYTKNEPIAVEIFKEYVKTCSHFYTESQVKSCTEAILETDINKNPVSVLGKILRDADLSSLGDKKFLKLSSNLKKESEHYKQSHLHKLSKNDSAWKKLQINFLSNHKWRTEEAFDLFQEQLKENINLLKAS